MNYNKNNNNRFEILIKFILDTNYNIKLKNWEINGIKKIQNTYNKISKDIQV